MRHVPWYFLPIVCFLWKFSQVLISSPVKLILPKLDCDFDDGGNEEGEEQMMSLCALSSTDCMPAASNLDRGHGSLHSCFGKSKEEVKDSFPLFTMGLEGEGALTHFKIKFYSKVS